MLDYESDEDGEFINNGWTLYTSLHKAAGNGDIEKLKNILKDERSLSMINQRDRFGCTPLRLSTTANHMECCNLLVNHGADPDISDIKGQTCLHIAVQNNNSDLASYYLSIKCNPNGAEKNISCPLYQAGLHENIHIIRDLVTHGALVDGTRSSDDIIASPLGIAIYKMNNQIVKFLLNAGADANLSTWPLNSLPRNKPRTVVRLSPLPPPHSDPHKDHGRWKMIWSRRFLKKISYTYLLVSKTSDDVLKVILDGRRALDGSCSGDYDREMPKLKIKLLDRKKEIMDLLLACGGKPYVHNASTTQNFPSNAKFLI